MRRTTVFLDEGLERDVKALAQRQGRTTASVVREALASYVTVHSQEGRGLSFLAAGNSGRSDVAERHEDLLFQELEPHEAGGPDDAGGNGR